MGSKPASAAQLAARAKFTAMAKKRAADKAAKVAQKGDGANVQK